MACQSSAEPIVPVIDISALHGEDAEARRGVADAIGKACRDIGFFVVVNHGIPQDVIREAWDRSLEFFDQPLQEKLRYKSEDAAAYPYGYSALGAEILSKGKEAETKENKAPAVGDMKEHFAIGPKDPKSGMPPRRLPEEPKAFADAFQAYYEATHALSEKLLRACALALGLSEDWFDGKMDRHISALRANNYPDQAGLEVPVGSIRCSAHTDYGTVTILKSGGPGLQVSEDKANPVWHDVPYLEDGFVINLGDLMRRWTNDQWSSTLHRVVNPPPEAVATWGRRMSLAFFHNLNKDAVVEAIPSCVSAEQPELYGPIVAGEFLMLKHLAANGGDPEAHLRQRSRE